MVVESYRLGENWNVYDKLNPLANLKLHDIFGIGFYLQLNCAGK